MEAFSRRERRKIISLYQSGLDTKDIAQQMGSSLSGVRRVWQQFREEGRDEPAFGNCGRKPTLSDDQMQEVRQIVQEKPDRFVREIAEEVELRLGIAVRRQRVGRWLGKLGLTQKKSVHAQEQQRPHVKTQRNQWMQNLTDVCDGDFSRVLFLDETGAMTNLIRSHGHSERGQRCVGFAPMATGKY